MHAQTRSSSRILIFDILRIVLLFLVLHIHFEILANAPIDFLSTYEYLAVPLFVTLSFYLTSKHFLQDAMPTRDLGTRLKRLVVPLIAWSLFGFLPHLPSLSLPNIVMQIATGELVNLSLYYLNLLVVITFICFVLTYIPRTVRIWVYGLITLLAFYLQYSLINYNFFHPQDPIWQYSYSRLVELLPYAMLGLGLGTLKSKFQTDWRFPVVAMLLGYGLYRVVTLFAVPLGFNYQGLPFFAQTLLIFSGVVLLARVKTEKEATKHLQTLGAYTFGVYLFHYPLIELLLSIFPASKGLIENYHMAFLLGFIGVSFLLCYAIDTLTKKRISYLLR